MDLPPHRCAECGRPFDPADPQTVNTGRPIPAYASWAVGPVSWPVYAVALGGAVVTLWRARLPYQPFSWAAPAVWALLGVAAVWLVWPAVRRAVLGHYGWPARVIKPMRRLHWVVPLVMAAVAVAAAMRLPPQVTFAVSRADMDRLAATVMAHPDAVYPPQRVGLFWAKNINMVSGGGMSFTADDRDAHDRVGFVFLRPGLKPNGQTLVNVRSATNLGGGWWSWKRGD